MYFHHIFCIFGKTKERKKKIPQTLGASDETWALSPTSLFNLVLMTAFFITDSSRGIWGNTAEGEAGRLKESGLEENLWKMSSGHDSWAHSSCDRTIPTQERASPHSSMDGEWAHEAPPLAKRNSPLTLREKEGSVFFRAMVCSRFPPSRASRWPCIHAQIGNTN